MIILTRDKQAKEIAKNIEDFLSESIRKARKELLQVTDLSSTVEKLRNEISSLEIDKSRRKEDFEKREREIEHKVGLERKRQEQELDLATRSAQLKAKEDNLVSERELFQKEMDFRNERFMKEVTYQRELSEKLLAMLPKMTIKQEIKE